MSTNNLTFDEAYNIIKVIRPSADINPGFESQLRAYAAANYDVYIAQQLLLRTRIRELYLLRETNAKDLSHVKSKSFQSTISIDTTFVPSKPPRSNSRQKRALSDAKEPLAELQLDFSYQSPLDKDGMGSAVTDGSHSANSQCSSFSGFRDNFDRKFDNRCIDIDTSTELEDSIASQSSEAKVPFKSPFNSKATMSTQSSGTTSSSYSLVSNIPSGGICVADTISLNNENGHLSSGSSCASDNVLDESHDSLYSIGSNVSFEQHGRVQPGTAEGHGRPKGHKSHRTTESLSTSEIKQPYQYEKKNLAIHPANENSNSSTVESQVSAKYPTCKLSRPVSNWIRIIPPLMGLEREFKCSWCNNSLFQLANVIRVDIENIQVMLEAYQQSMKLLNIRSSTYSKLKRDFDDVIPQDELEEAFIQQNCQPHGTTHSIDHIVSHRPSSADGSCDPSVSFLPPITKKNSQKPIGGFSFGVGSNNSQDIVAPLEMEVEEFAKPFAPLKTCRANSKINRGFTFESASMDDNDVPMSVTKQQISASSNSYLPKGSHRTFLNDMPYSSSDIDDKVDHLNVHLHPPLSGSKSFSSIHKVIGNTEIPAMRQSPRVLPSIQHQSSPPSQEKQDKKMLGVNTNQQCGLFNNASIPSVNTPLYDESPRVSIPPHKLLPENNYLSVSSRPSSANGNSCMKSQSAEKRRWLARLSLLRDTATDSTGSSKSIKHRIANISDADDIATQYYINDPMEKYFYVEYLPWMGGEVFQYPKDHGEICCPGCNHVVGSWSWNPSPR